MEDIAVLITEGTPTYDAEGNEIQTRTERQVFVREESVSRSEFYNAAQAGLRPEVILILSEYIDYNGERLVKYHNKEYSIIRTYRAPDENELELTLEEKIGNE